MALTKTLPRDQLGVLFDNNPRAIRVFESISGDQETIQQQLEGLVEEVKEASPGTYNVRLFTEISTLVWDQLGREAPDSIRTAGRTVAGMGAATYVREVGPLVENVYQTQDGSGNWWRLSFTEIVEPEQLGAVGDATIVSGVAVGTDDSVAWNLAVSGLWPAVRANPVGYLVGDLKPCNLKPTADVCVFGAAGLGYTDNTNPFNPRAVPTFIRQVGAQAVFDLGWLRGFNPADLTTYNLPIPLRSVTLMGLHIDGVARDCFGVSGGSNRLRLFHVQIINCAAGIGGRTLGADGLYGSAYSRSLRALNVAVQSCDIGMQNFVDSQFLGCEVANCATFGFHGTNGANSNTWIGGRDEFTQGIVTSGPTYAGGINIELNNCSDNIFMGFMSDRGAMLGFSLTSCVDVQFVGIKWRRSGAFGNVGFQSDAYGFIQDCQEIDITSCTTSRGHADGGAPPDTPDNGYIINGTLNNGIRITGGNIIAPLPLKYSPLRSNVANHIVNGVGGVEDYDNSGILNKADGLIFYAPDYVSPLLDPAGTDSVTFTVPGIKQFEADQKTLTIVTRWDTGSGSRNHIKFSVFQHQEGAGTTGIDFIPYAEFGTAGAVAFGTGTAISIAVSSISDDASTFTLTFTNTDATHKIQVFARMTP